MLPSFEEKVFVLFFILFVRCYGIYGRQNSNFIASGTGTQSSPIVSSDEQQRGRREPMMPFLGFPGPMMYGGYRARSNVGANTPMMEIYKPTNNNETSNTINITHSYTNDTNTTYENENYEPNYCEIALIEELTRAIKYIIAYDLDGKYGKLKKRRYGVKITSILPEAVYEASYNGNDVVETITKSLEDEYKFIPRPMYEQYEVKEYEIKRFKEKAKYVTKDILNGLCKYIYCCLPLETLTTVEHTQHHNNIY